MDVLAQATDSSAAEAAVLGFVGFCLYFAPTIVGAARKVTNLGSIIVINLFLGWTFIGWVVALAMAVRTVKPSAPARVDR